LYNDGVVIVLSRKAVAGSWQVGVILNSVQRPGVVQSVGAARLPPGCRSTHSSKQNFKLQSKLSTVMPRRQNNGVYSIV